MNEIVIIGGANIDYYAMSNEAIIAYDSNIGTLNKAFGGVGRNIAETLGRLGLAPLFISALSLEDEGRLLYNHLLTHGVDVAYTPLKKTSSYLAVMDHQKELYVAINDMQALEIALNPMFLKEHQKTIAQCDFIVIEPNLSKETIHYLFDTYNSTFIVDGLSATKVKKIKPFLHQINILKINRQETEVLLDCKLTDYDLIHDAALKLLNNGVKHVFITLGEQGVVYGHKKTVTHQRVSVSDIKNTTGAGDAFLSGVIYATIFEKNPLFYGIAASEITLQSEHSVSELMNEYHLLNTVRRLNDESTH